MKRSGKVPSNYYNHCSTTLWWRNYQCICITWRQRGHIYRMGCCMLRFVQNKWICLLYSELFDGQQGHRQTCKCVRFHFCMRIKQLLVVFYTRLQGNDSDLAQRSSCRQWTTVEAPPSRITLQHQVLSQTHERLANVQPQSYPLYSPPSLPPPSLPPPSLPPPPSNQCYSRPNDSTGNEWDGLLLCVPCNTAWRDSLSWNIAVFFFSIGACSCGQAATLRFTS